MQASLSVPFFSHETFQEWRNFTRNRMSKQVRILSLRKLKYFTGIFAANRPPPPRPQTIAHNLARLKCIMKRGDFKTVGKIDKITLPRK
jgi:hypothetical protein